MADPLPPDAVRRVALPGRPGQPGGVGRRPGGPGQGVLACGLATLDVVQTVEHVPGPDEKLVATDLLVAAGGPAANAAVTCAVLGVPARLLTRVGGGALGALVTADLGAWGVDVVDVADAAGGAGSGAATGPPVSTVLVTRSTGQRAVVSVNATHSARRATQAGGRATSAGGGDADRSVPPEVWDGVGVVLVDGHHLDLALACAREARGRGIPVVLDGGSWKPGLAELLALVDVAVLSADFVVPGEPDALAAVRAAGPRVAAQSHGAEPVVVAAEGGSVPVAVPPVAVVDTLGAGDVLHGGLVAWLASRGGGGAHAGVALDRVLAGLAWAVEVASASCGFAGSRGWAEDSARVAAWRRDLAALRGA